MLLRIAPPIAALLIAALLIAALALAACVPTSDPLVIDLEFKKGDLVIYARAEASTENRELQEVGHTFVDGPELQHAITTTEDDSLMVFVVHAEAFQRASGEITDIARRDLDVRLANTPSKADVCNQACRSGLEACLGGCMEGSCREACKETSTTCKLDCADDPGNCGRCLVPSSTPPQIVNDGDSCEMPQFAEGRYYLRKENGYERSEASADLAALANAGHKIRIDWAQPCSCSAGSTTKNFDNFSIRPISPPEAPWALSEFAESAQGVVAGARDRAVIAFDRIHPPAVTEFTDIQADTRSIVALRNGDFLMASDPFNSEVSAGYRFDRLRWVTDHLEAPERIGENINSRPNTMKHLGRTANAPLFLIGGRPGLTQSEPAMFGCSEDPFGCTSVPITPCGGEVNGLFINDAVALDNGAGVAYGSRAIYLKRPGPANPDPVPTDNWTCNEFPRDMFVTTKGESIALSGLKAIGSIGNRVFLCATREAPPCMPYYPVVLTATVTEDATMPEWHIIAEGDDWTDCRRMIPIPGDPPGSTARALMSNGRLLDLTANGTLAQRGAISSIFASGTPGWNEMQLMETGNLLAKTKSNGAYISDGVGTFEKLIGPSVYHAGHYTTVVPLPAGGFLAFGTGHEITRIRPGESPEVGFVEDPMNLFPGTDAVRDAVLDTTRTDPAMQIVLATSGYSDTDVRHPLVRLFYLDPSASTIVNVEDVNIPDTFLGLSVEGIAEVGPKRFVAYSEGTLLMRIEEYDAHEIPLSWDAIDTAETQEAAPPLAPDQCSHVVPRLDAFRDIDARGGVAWVVGAYGLVVRVVGDRAERFMPRATQAEGSEEVASNADIRTVRASCPDRAIAGGLYMSPSDDTGRSMRAWKIVPKSEPTDECIPRGTLSGVSTSEEGGQLTVREVSEATSSLCVDFPSRELLYSTPNVLVPDGEDAALVMDTGTIQRITTSAERESRLQVPFFVLSAYEDGQGHVLFGGYDAHLALGSSSTSP